MFTDLASAIEEAQYLKQITKKCHVVIQKRNGEMAVKKKHHKAHKNYLYSTASKGVVKV